MKCPKCRRDMRRIKVDEHQYVYQCPNCRKRVGSQQTPENKEEEKDQSAS